MTGEEVPCCPACGSPIDYCQGHGEVGDPRGHRILAKHDNGEHDDCDPNGCEVADQRLGPDGIRWIG